MPIRPIKSNVLIKLAPIERASVSGLTLVDYRKHWDHKTREAEVVAVGPWVKDVEAGDRVVIKGSAGKWVDAELGDADLFRIVKQSDLMAVYVKSREDAGVLQALSASGQDTQAEGQA